MSYPFPEIIVGINYKNNSLSSLFPLPSEYSWKVTSCESIGLVNRPSIAED